MNHHNSMMPKTRKKTIMEKLTVNSVGTNLINEKKFDSKMPNGNSSEMSTAFYMKNLTCNWGISYHLINNAKKSRIQNST